MTSKLLAGIGIATGLLFTACSSEPTAAEKQAMNANWSSVAATDAKLAGVLIYADWCGSCKVLDPKIQAVRAGGPINGVTYIKLDYTKKDKAAFFAAADTAGVGVAVRAHLSDGVGTGQLLLVDIDDQKVVGVVKKTSTNVDIAKEITNAANNA